MKPDSLHLQTKVVSSGPVTLGGSAPPLIIAGPDTLESERLVLEVAHELKALSKKLSLTIVFKGSYDKANRSSAESYRGPGLERGLEMLRRVKEETGMPTRSRRPSWQPPRSTSCKSPPFFAVKMICFGRPARRARSSTSRRASSSLPGTLRIGSRRQPGPARPA